MPDGGVKPAGKIAFGEAGHPSKKWYTVSLILSVVVGLVVFLWPFLISGKLKSVAQERTSLDDQLSSKKNKELEARIRSVKAAAEGLKVALQGTFPTVELVQTLEARLPKDVVILSLSVDEKGQLKLDGETTTYTSVAKFMVSLRSSGSLDKIKLTGLSGGTDGERVRFTITLTSDPKKLTTPVEKPPTNAAPGSRLEGTSTTPKTETTSPAPTTPKTTGPQSRLPAVSPSSAQASR